MSRTTKRVLSLILCVVLIAASIGIYQIAFGVSVFGWTYPRNTDGISEADSDFGTPQLTFMNDWSCKAIPLGFELFTIAGEIVYCIEPNVGYGKNDYTPANVDFWSQVYNPAKAGGLPAEKAREFLGLILSNGYQGTLGHWKIYDNETGRKIMNAYATQVLVWEVITGERDANFNLVTPPPGVNKQTDRIKLEKPENATVRQWFFDYYNSIAQSVKEANGNRTPSFASLDAENAPQYTMNYEDGVFSIRLTNQNGTIGDGVTFKSSLENVNFKKEGTQLVIESDEEFEGIVNVEVTAYSSYSEPIIISDGIFGSGNGIQDMIRVAQGSQGVTTQKSYFNLEFPHVRKYVPFETEPTCIQRGYTKWICRCGDSYVLNYVDALGHDFCFASAKAATCTENGVEVYRCHRCGATEAKAIPATGHGTPVYATTIAPTCTKDGEKVGYCDICGMAIASEPIPATGHGETVLRIDAEPTADHEGQATPYCSVCGEAVGASVPLAPHTHEAGVEMILKEATCTAAGEKGTYCKICNACYDVKPIEALGHDPIAVVTLPATCTVDGESSSFCSRCGKLTGSDVIPASGHQNGAWKVSTPATCTTDGREVCTCAVCGEICDSRVISASGHDSGAWMTKVPATCTTDGEEVQICTRCNAVTATRVLSAPGHDSGVWTQTAAATCIADGEKVCTCTRCGQVIDSEKITATGHDIGVWMIDYEATPDHDGQMSLYCTICKQVLDTKTFEPHPHVEGYNIQLLAPTCTTEGEGGVVCDVCGAVYRTYTMSALGHDYGAWSTNNNGTHKKTCSRCHDLQTENCKYTVVVLEPTCTEGGYTTHTCDVCGYTYTDDFKDPLGHDFSDWQDEKDGETHSRVCARCGEKEYEGHWWGEWKYNRNAGLFRNGTKTRECTVCHALQTEKAHHTSWICRVFYPIALFISNLLIKLGYTTSLNWLFPWLNIPPTM